MQYTEQELDILIHQLLDIGEAMLCAGAEINRVEDTLSRLGRAYGAERTNVFVITASIVITLGYSDRPEMTQTRRILTSGSNDFVKIEKLNALSRRCIGNPPAVTELREEVRRIVSESPSPYVLAIGSVLSAAFFAVFFGGNLWDALVAAGCAMMIFLLQRYFLPLCSNRLLFNFLCSAAVGFVTLGCCALFPVLNADKIMIGDIMLLIPGIVITNSMRNMILGDTISGLEKLVEALFLAGAIAGGFMFAIWAAGGNLL